MGLCRVQTGVEHMQLVERRSILSEPGVFVHLTCHQASPGASASSTCSSLVEESEWTFPKRGLRVTVDERTSKTMAALKIHQNADNKLSMKHLNVGIKESLTQTPQTEKSSKRKVKLSKEICQYPIDFYR